MNTSISVLHFILITNEEIIFFTLTTFQLTTHFELNSLTHLTLNRSKLPFSGGPWKCKTPVTLRGLEFQLLREENFECNNGETPVTCPYHYDPISNKIIRGNSIVQENYALDVMAEFDGETIKVEWDKDTLLVADDKIKRFQVLLYYEGHYMATTFPVEKDQYSLSLKDILPSDITKFNVCVEVMSISDEIITFSCVYFTSDVYDISLESKTNIMIGIIAPLILVAIIVVVVVVYLTRCRKPVSKVQSQGIHNVMYDRYKDNEFCSETPNTSQISISGLPSDYDSQEVTA